MSSYCRVVVMGNLCAEVEVRFTKGGTAVTEVTVAVNDKRKSTSGEWIESTTFVDCVLWGRTAEIAGEYLSKGSNVLIDGRLETQSWEKDGQKRSKLKVVCENLRMLGGNKRPADTRDEVPPRGNRPPATNDDGEDIPF
jgi:single-strand DNA-binding protein